jgi:predicted O-methyltransferase YrrM
MRFDDSGRPSSFATEFTVNRPGVPDTGCTAGVARVKSLLTHLAARCQARCFRPLHLFASMPALATKAMLHLFCIRNMQPAIFDNASLAGEIAGQLNAAERHRLIEAIANSARPPRAVLEIGTWLGGGSTVHLLRALERRGNGHLWGVEADRSVYERMVANLRAAAPEAVHRFTPLFGFSQEVLPRWLAEQPPGFELDLAFLDGGNNPMEQIVEFNLLDPFMPVGAQLLAHDAKLRKGRFLVPFVSALDNWESQLHDISAEGLFQARKIAREPSPASCRAADAVLRRLRRRPAELAARVLPHWARAAALRCLPARFARKLSDGR